ncbi:MAG: PrgI family protein [Candidatus Paceibacterota bacterium]
MQFKVPQFLDIEDKIFGPFTFKEFAYLAGGAGLSYVLYKVLGFTLGSVPILIVACLTLALTFYKPNNKPFIFMLEAGFNYFRQDKLFIWKKRKVKINKLNEEMRENTEAEKKRQMIEHQVRLGGNKLRDLAWSLDVLDLNKHNE